MKKNFLITFMIICIIIFTYSGIKIIKWKLDNDKSKEIINNIIEEAIITPTIEEPSEPDENNIESQKIEEKDNNKTKDDDPEYLNIDFKKLNTINNETVGWIKVENTQINYPYVQTIDNKYYLNHSFDKKENSTGWLFLDYRNNRIDFDKNNIIYGHNMRSGLMFGTLYKVFEKKWQKNENNHYIQLVTPTKKTIWQVFSTYYIENSSDYLEISFSSDEEFINFIDLIKNRSIYNFNVEVTENDKILTLSTCYTTSEYKTVLHAKLIFEEKK